MNRGLFLLNGLAILGVVISHAAGWGQVAMYDWGGHIRETVDPGYNPVGGILYFVLISIRMSFCFSVAAFLYVSAWFTTYAVGKQHTLPWKTVKMRILTMLIPYLIWSTVIFASDWVLGTRYSFHEYLFMLFFTGAEGTYYFVPLLCYMYLISPLIIPLARDHWKPLLIITGFIQAAATAIHYISFINHGPVINFLWTITPDWSLPRWIFFFAFGMVCGFHSAQFKQWAEKIRWQALAAGVILIVLAVIEYNAFYRYTEANSQFHRGIGWGDAPVTFFTILYSLTFLISFQNFNKLLAPVSNILYQLGSRSYGLYLLHMKIMEVVARVIYHVAPIILVYQIIYQPILWVAGLGGALLFMYLVANTPARKYYRPLFG